MAEGKNSLEFSRGLLFQRQRNFSIHTGWFYPSMPETLFYYFLGSGIVIGLILRWDGTEY